MRTCTHFFQTVRSRKDEKAFLKSEALSIGEEGAGLKYIIDTGYLIVLKKMRTTRDENKTQTNAL